MLGRLHSGHDPRRTRPTNNEEDSVTSNGTDAKHSAPHKTRKLRLNLPASVTLKLARAGILCDPVVTLEYQGVARRHVVRGVESGGAVPGFGHYVLFCD